MGFATLERPRHPGSAILRFGVACLSALLVVVLTGFVVVEVRPEWLAGLRNAMPAPAPHFALRGGTPGGAPVGSTPVGDTRGGASRSDAPGSSTAAPADGPLGVAPGSVFAPTGGGAPIVASIQPSSGGPGVTLALTGQRLFSRDGQIEVTVAGHDARVRCPSQERCLVTVPDLGGTPRATGLVLRTDAGWSNTVAFGYR